MLWLCAYTSLRPETEKALHEHVPPGDAVRLIDVSRDDYAYGRHLQEMWDHGVDFANVEHDNLLRADIAKAFHECPEPWCSVPYDWTTNRGPAIGMVRWRKEFLAKHPDAMREAAATPSAWGAPGHYRQVGYWLTERVLAGRGERAHIHLPACEHLNESQALMPEVAGLSDEEHLRRLGYAEWAT